MKRRGLALVTGLVLVGLLTGCGSLSFSTPHPTANRGPKEPNVNLTMVEVLRVVDGDTIEVLYNGKKEDVRLIGVDTPETVHPSKPVQPYGPEASAFTKAQLTGKRVGLEFDVEQRDRYGRLLAYVWLDNKMFNRTLIQEGYAQVATFPPNVKYVDDFTRLQKEAREARRGLWGLESPAAQASNPPPGKGAPPATWQPADGQCIWDGQERIKGNISSGGEKIYHAPGQRYYGQTKADECFASGKDAEVAGYRASKS
jgi:micrococcal nuclease